ncbi:hypothetical protein NECAME_17609 [Necator americanus]|uniref:Uncharacterized protein n=1 Tax=Necator americanus TaxID=51031 RepID=W2TMD1_NECAM|nr:hypothetical protein NECAME_17609 [Necator americanus]ETN82923.1 hypothetical protein NECAME_17609 [Necator americanus]
MQHIENTVLILKKKSTKRVKERSILERKLHVNDGTNSHNREFVNDNSLDHNREHVNDNSSNDDSEHVNLNVRLGVVNIGGIEEKAIHIDVAQERLS